MQKAVPFVDFFPNIYPQRRVVKPEVEHNLVGVILKSIVFHKQEEALLCRGLVVRGQHANIYTTVHLKVTDITPVVGYDLDLILDQDGEEEMWEVVQKKWSKHFAGDPVNIHVFHDDIKRQVNAQVFPLKCISLAKTYVETVRGALTFGDFCPDKGYYMYRDGNTPALCSNVMFGRMYFLPTNKLNGTLSASELIYDHDKSVVETKLFDSEHMPYFYKAACLDIETVFDKYHRDTSLICESFAYKFPYCTQSRVANMTEYRAMLVQRLNVGRKQLPKQKKNVTIPTLSPDMPGQQHEITCVSLVILNSHIAKMSADHHRKALIVLYNKCKVTQKHNLEADYELAKGVGIEDVKRISFYPCSGELRLLETTIRLLYDHGVELLYVFNAEFDVRVIEQRVHFYADSDYAKRCDSSTQKRCSSLLRAWHGLFVTRAMADDVLPFFQFENVRYLEMYKDMLNSLGSVLQSATLLTEYKLQLISNHIDKFNRGKAKLGHFKMNSCGMNIIDLYRMAGTKEIKFACTSMKLNDVAPFVIAKVRELHKKPPKDARKLYKVADVSYSKMDEMITMGGKSLFAVLIYNLVDSQLCARLAKVLNPVSSLFHRCRTTLNIDVVVHGRGDNFGGFVQSIHSVQIPQLKFRLDTLRVKAGPVGMELNSRQRWQPQYNPEWEGGAVFDPITGLHYSGPGMGLELSFDFSGMYPSIMCALNISPETIIPWPPVNFPHDLSGWVCYNWAAEGFEYASLILKYDQAQGAFVRLPAVLSSSVEYYLNQRAEFKRTLKNPDISEVERVYCTTQEGECKILANSFYGTAPHPCGPLISGHGRQQISVVNSCVSTFYRHGSPVVYGDTDSVMVSVGYTPGQRPENDVSDVDFHKKDTADPGPENERLESFAYKARKALADKFEQAGAQVPEFLNYVHTALVEDTLKRMYLIGSANKHQNIVRDPSGRFTKEGYPVYGATVPGSEDFVDVTGPFVRDRRVKLEYENSSSIYCHVAKKTYVALTHNLDDKGSLSSVSVKVRGLSAFKSIRTPCDSAVTDTFIACVMRGDCIKLATDDVSCFSTCPWHQLKRGDVIFYLAREPLVDDLGRWLEVDQASSFLTPCRVADVTTLQLDSGFSAASTTLTPVHDNESLSGANFTVRTLYKDLKYCMNHIFSRKQSILRDLLACKASEIIASKMGAGFFPWSSLIKSSKNKHFSQQTLDRLKVSNASIKTTYVEIVKRWLKQITGLSITPVECYEYHKCNPCEAAFHRYPLNLQAKTGCITAMFGGSLQCEANRRRPGNVSEDNKKSDGYSALGQDGDDGSGDDCKRQDEPLIDDSSQTGLVSRPNQPNTCFANSRVWISHCADSNLVNDSGKLLAHCIIDYCLPCHMYSPALGQHCLEDCEQHLLTTISSVRERSKRATVAFNTVMYNCPEHMIPACGIREFDHLKTNRETVTRMPGDKLEVCRKVIVEDMSLRPSHVYKTLSVLLGKKLSEAISEGIVSLRDDSSIPPCSDSYISISLPSVILTDAGIKSSTGRLSIARGQLCERRLVDLAGLLCQAVIMLQIHTPNVFDSVPVMYPESLLCIMPYSCEDVNLMQRWLETFSEKNWLKRIKAKLGKRKRSTEDYRRVSYHCTGCKHFYRLLKSDNVSPDGILDYVYDQDKRRKMGQCISESRWLSQS